MDSTSTAVANSPVSSGMSIPEQTFKKGLLLGLPIAVGYLPIAMAFGLLAKTSGLSFIESFAMSVFIFAGASQFVGVNLISLGVGFGEIIFTTFVLNFRHFLMASAMIERLMTTGRKKLLYTAFGLTDETFAVATLQHGKLANRLVIGIQTLAYSAWLTGTVIGFFLSSALPVALQMSMGVALYAMFIGLLVPAMRKSGRIAAVAVSSALLNSGFPFYLPTGWAIILATLVTATGAAAVFKEDTA